MSCANSNQPQRCEPDGSSLALVETCAADCIPPNGTTAAHCRYLEPKWLPDICNTPATEAVFMPNASAAYSSDLDTNCTGGVVPQPPPGASICVVRAQTITIPQGVALDITGSRPIAFVADTSLVVHGTLDGKADGSSNRPGGGASASGTLSTSTAGGGGAGFAAMGGNGGSTATGNGGVGGTQLVPLTLAFFAGGPHAPYPLSLNPNGGGGGGAILLAACRGSVTLSGTSTIDVGGGGGQPQHDLILGGGISQSNAGAGGGAGGYVVVQGLTGVTVAAGAGIFANGGGGGGGCTTNDGSGSPGQDGTQSTSLGGGGGAGSGLGATGGRGASRGNAAGAGGGTTSGTAGGGGGGASGVLQVYTPLGVAPTIDDNNVSPLFATDKIVPTR